MTVMTKGGWLDDLQDLIDTLQKRIKEHGQVLRNNETATRYALIDPVLVALGWDLSDPNKVLAEYRADSGGKFDYAMQQLGGKPPRLLVEAKSLHAPDSDLANARKQAMVYSVDNDVEYFVVTDGDRWKGYKSPKDEVFDFLMSDASRSQALRLLWLWRGNIMHEHPAAGDQTGGTEGSEYEDDEEETPPGVVFTLAESPPEAGDPAWIRFSDGTKHKISKWYELQTKVVEWLLRERTVRRLITPTGVYLVNTEPIRNRSGTEMGNPKPVGDLWIEAQYSRASHVQRAREILQACGRKPNSVKVELAD